MSKVADFKVLKIEKLPLDETRKMIADDKLGGFWGSHSPTAASVGCYVFAVSKRGGYVEPWYVGKATKSFKQEVFSTDKQLKFAKMLNKDSGKAELYLLQLEKQKGPTNRKAIGELEDFLIEVGFKKNPKLLNKRGKPVLLFSIRGVLPAKQGEAKAKAAKKFRAAMDL